MPTLREWVIEWVVMIGIGVALAALGPFGSFAIGSFGARLAYWVPAALLGYLIFRPTTLTAVLAARRLALPELPAAVLGTLVAAIPGTFAIAWMDGYRGEPGRFEALFELYVQVALIGVLVMLVFLLIDREPESARLPSALASPDVPDLPGRPTTALSAPFLDRLPAAWRDRLVALEMEDHYVRAHGPGVSALILLRMGDAEAELANLDGLRVHRSWWVARRAVERVLRDGRNTKLRLSGGIEAPVARDRVAALRERGWID